VLPFDWAKKMYLKTHESGWGKIHELIRKEGSEVFYSTINHIKKHTMYEQCMMPEDHKHLLDGTIAKREKSQKDTIERIRRDYYEQLRERMKAKEAILNMI